MPTYRVGASTFVVITRHRRNVSFNTGGAANTAGTSYGPVYGIRAGQLVMRPSEHFAELEVTPPPVTAEQMARAGTIGI